MPAGEPFVFGINPVMVGGTVRRRQVMCCVTHARPLVCTCDVATLSSSRMTAHDRYAVVEFRQTRNGRHFQFTKKGDAAQHSLEVFREHGHARTGRYWRKPQWFHKIRCDCPAAKGLVLRADSTWSGCKHAQILFTLLHRMTGLDYPDTLTADHLDHVLGLPTGPGEGGDAGTPAIPEPAFG